MDRYRRLRIFGRCTQATAYWTKTTKLKTKNELYKIYKN